ncbi:hypothetical protein [Maribellus maritimus]|uniref:hypothetical protein n=1 Tax=Maribellus maritimus TaxID=2870838 RepID=UPI001EEA3608|nr:hypothetical protein [Maribellus maritimus]MCG6187649.1 hypothetical protein [Maribellus maritimus]
MPVQFYGLPDGKVYILYAKFFKVGYEKSGLEFVIAEHEEFSFDYEKGQLIQYDSSMNKIHVYSETVDKPNPKIKIINVFRSIKSFAEAFEHLNEKAKKILKNNNIQEKHIEVDADNEESNRKSASA